MAKQFERIEEAQRRFIERQKVFFTGTAAEVTPVRSIDRITIGSGKRGPVTASLQDAFFAVINGDVPDTHGWLTFVYEEEASLREPAGAAASGKA